MRKEADMFRSGSKWGSAQGAEGLLCDYWKGQQFDVEKPAAG